jgi:hypothetical protein
MTASFKNILAHEIKPLSARIDNEALAARVSSAVGAHLDAHLAGIVQHELRRLPLEAAVRSVVAEQSASWGRELERAIAPVVPRTIATVVQPAVERATREAVEAVLVPAVVDATNRTYDQLADDIKTEMVQVRKDVNADQGDALSATNAMLRSMAGTIADLQKQVAELAGQLQQQQRQAAQPQSQQHAQHVHAHVHTHPHQQQNQQVQQQQQRSATPVRAPTRPLPSPQVLEDAFVQAIRDGSRALVQLIEAHMSDLDAILPTAPGSSPLPQGVLLMLAHQLSVVLDEQVQQAQQNVYSPLFSVIATWLLRAVQLVDARDTNIASYLPRAAHTLTQRVRATVDTLEHTPPGPQVAAHIDTLHQILRVLAGKGLYNP